MIGIPKQEKSEALSRKGQGFYNGNRPGQRANTIQKEDLHMLRFKTKVLAIGMAAILLVPGNVYGHSMEMSSINLNNCITQFVQFLADWGICLEEGTFPEIGWPEAEAPNPERPQLDRPEMEESVPQMGIAQEMLAKVNQQRRSAGLAELSLSQELTKVANIKAEDMRDQGYFSHISPNYGSPFDMMKEFGISYRTAGENIAKGQKNVEAVMNGWMNSSGHRENILNAKYTHLGVGYCIDNAGNPYWVQMFIQK